MVADRPAPRPLSMIAQTAWQDLLRLLKDQQVAALHGEPQRKTIGGRAYWYDRFRVGARIVERYIGEDSEETAARIAQYREIKDRRDALRRESARLVRLLRGEGLLAPDIATGQMLAAMARVGVFRLGGTVVGTQAFRHYEGVLGVAFGADRAAVTDDVDIASFERLSISLGATDGVDPALGEVFRDLGFDPVPSLDRRHVWRWRSSTRAGLVEFLTPSFREDESLRELPALGVSAQSLHYLNYLIAGPIAVPLLYRSGALIQVPRPERYAIHKLIVADRRRQDGETAGKARKDRMQAALLVGILAEESPDLLAEAYEDALGRGPSWRERIARTLDALPDTRDRLEALA